MCDWEIIVGRGETGREPCLKWGGMTRSWESSYSSSKNLLWWVCFMYTAGSPGCGLKQQSYTGNFLKSFVTHVRGGLHFIYCFFGGLHFKFWKPMIGSFSLPSSYITIYTNQNTHLAREENCHFGTWKNRQTHKNVNNHHCECGKYRVIGWIRQFAAFYASFLLSNDRSTF